MKYHIGLLILLVSLSKAAAQQVVAQPTTSDTSIVRLSEVVITSDQQRIAGHVVPPHELKGSSANIANALDHLPGFFKVQNNNYSLVYRGFYGNRLRIEQNGARRTGVTASGGFFGEDVNPENISQISIVNGVDKAIYGSGAMGGVVLMDEWRTPSKNSASVYQSYATNNSLLISGLKTTLADHRKGVTISLRNSQSGDYQIPVDGFGNGSGNVPVNHSAYEQSSVSVAGFLRDPSGKHLLNLIQKASKGLWERPQGFQNNPFELRSFRNKHNYQTDLRHVYNDQGKWRIKQQVSLQFMETDQIQRSFNATMENLNIERTRTYLKSTQGYRVTASWNTSSPWKMEFGLDGYRSVLDERESENNMINDFVTNDEPVSVRRDLQGGLFALLGNSRKDWYYRLATRLDIGEIASDDNRQTLTVVTGGLEAGWQVSKLLSSRWSLGRFFRYPSQLEATGVVFGGRGTFFGNPEIQPEYSYQLEWQLSGKRQNLSYQLTSWYTYFDGRISEVPTGNNTFTYENVANAQNIGLEFVLNQRFLLPPSSSSVTTPTETSSRAISVMLTGTYIIGDELSEGIFSEAVDPLLGTPPSRWSFMTRYEGRWLQTDWSIHSRLDRVHRFDRLPTGFINQTFGVVEVPAYWLLNVGVEMEKEISRYQLHLGINGTNLTNSRYSPFGTRVPEMGRNLQFNLRCSF